MAAIENQPMENRIITLEIPQFLEEKLIERAKINLRSFNNEVLYILVECIRQELDYDRRIQRFLKDWLKEADVQESRTHVTKSKK